MAFYLLYPRRDGTARRDPQHCGRRRRCRRSRTGSPHCALNGGQYTAITEHELEALYDRRRSRVVVALNTGVELAFPTRLAKGLADALPDDLVDIEISPAGPGLHWPRLDADLYVPALLHGYSARKAGWLAS